jgi:hemoglobin-like flavoprotein
MTEQVVELFHDSLERCRHAAPDFLDAFYDRLLATSSEVRALFRDTDFARQKRMLTVSFYTLLGAAHGHPEGRVHIERLATLHAARGVREPLYDTWLGCLLETVAQCDPAFSPAVADAWSQFMTPGIDVMKALAPQ